MWRTGLGGARQLDAERAQVELDQARAVQAHALLDGRLRRLAVSQQPLQACGPWSPFMTHAGAHTCCGITLSSLPGETYRLRQLAAAAVLRRGYWHTMPHLLCASCLEACKGVRYHDIAEAPLA